MRNENRYFFIIRGRYLARLVRNTGGKLCEQKIGKLLASKDWWAMIPAKLFLGKKIKTLILNV